MIKKTSLPNGTVVISETLPFSTSAAIGFWFKIGSKDEPPDKYGYAHLIEHMLFKGTVNRTAKEIAIEVDKIGAYLNAGTTKDYTSYYINVSSEKIEKALEILIDIVQNPVFDSQELEKEKLVILEEFRMYEDTPSDMVHDYLYEALLGNSPYGHPVLGDKAIVQKASSDSIRKFYRKYYNSCELIVSSAGKIEHNLLVDFIKENLNLPENKINKQEEKVEFKFSRKLIPKDLSQIHLCLGFKALPVTSEYRFALYVFNTIFGAAMSSRLFQKIREDKGLCYSIYSFLSLFKEFGIFGIYTGTNLSNFEQTIGLILKEIELIQKKGITQEELENAKEHLKGHLALAYEKKEVRMDKLAIHEMNYGRQFTYNEIIGFINKVSMDDVNYVINTLFRDNFKTGIASIGREEHIKIIEKYL